MKGVAVKESPKEAAFQCPITAADKDTAIAKIVVWPEEGIDAWSVSAYNAANEQIGETVTERKRRRAVKVAEGMAHSSGAALTVEDDPNEGDGFFAALSRLFR